MSLITSHSNPKIKQARALRQHKARQAARLFLVEGLRHVGEAIEAGAAIEGLYYAPDLLKSAFGRQLVESQEQASTPCYALAPEVFASIAEKENPQGILAVVRQNPASLEQLEPRNFDWGVALVSPQDPGNLGTILRAIDATGASGLILLDEGVDPYHPSAVRASMGALFWYPVASTTFGDFAGWANEHSYHVYGTSAHASLDYRQVRSYARPRILLMGSERQGLSPVQLSVCEQVIRLPMCGRATSLNLGVATGIFLYNMLAGDPAL
jgi:RNA methyltransferase, TrmH family